MANQRISDLYAANPVASPTGSELIEVSVPDGSGGYVSGAGKQSDLAGGGGGGAVPTTPNDPVTDSVTAAGAVLIVGLNPLSLWISNGTVWTRGI